MEYAVMAQEKPSGCMFEFDLDVCRSVNIAVTH